MNQEWNKLRGELSFEERQLVNRICEQGLQETRELLKTQDIKIPQARTRGAIQAFEIIADHQFETFEGFVNQWEKLEKRRIKLQSERGTVIKYWETRGQQLQIEFVLDRLLAYRVMRTQVKATISARAANYVGDWWRSQK